MKTFLASFGDLDSYIYIIISIVILVLSGISSARKRKAQQARASQGTPESDETGTEEASPVGNFQNPMERIEQLLTGQQVFGSYNETEFVEDEEFIQEEASLETTEEKILPEEGVPIVGSLQENEKADDDPPSVVKLTGPDRTLIVNELFKDIDEIKKAVIYNEIFNRKYI